MQIVRDPQIMAPHLTGASAAIGNFDGVHLGHQHVIDLARGRGPLGIVTFEPHPREYFAPDSPPFRLMNAAARASRLEKIGVDVLFELPFDAGLAGTSETGFVTEILQAQLGLRHVVVGKDFRFGKGRTGDASLLFELGRDRGLEVTIADTVSDATGRVSSTAIRTALSEARPRDAAAMLGHWHRIEGPVIHGEKRGRELGYPTANMGLEGLHLPALGVYAVLVDVLDGAHAGRYHGVSSLGIRPMFGENTPNLETYLFDFKGDLYDAQVSVGLVEFLRPEERFDDIDGLVTQMDADSAGARAVLAALEPAP